MATDTEPAWPSLAITPGQTHLTANQRSALKARHSDDIPEDQLLILLHVADRTGLDPFRGEIYLIEEPRPLLDGHPDPEAPRVWSVATAIGGYRRIAYRDAVSVGEALSLGRPEWYDTDSGTWVDVWPEPDRRPAAARFTAEIALADGRTRHGSGIAHYTEFVRRGPDEAPTRAWAERPCHMLGISAEGQALRHAYPDAFAGLDLDLTTAAAGRRDIRRPGSDTVDVQKVSVTELLGEDAESDQPEPTGGRTAPDRVTTTLDTGAPTTAPKPESAAPARRIHSRRQTALRRQLRDAGHTSRTQMREYLCKRIDPALTSVAGLTPAQAAQLEQALNSDSAARASETTTGRNDTPSPSSGPVTDQPG